MKKEACFLTLSIAVTLALTACGAQPAPAAPSPEAPTASVSQTPAQPLTLDMVLEMAQENSYADQDFAAFSNGERQELRENSPNYCIRFFFKYMDDGFILEAFHLKDGNALSSIYLKRQSNYDTLPLYTTSGEQASYEDVHYFSIMFIPSTTRSATSFPKD